VTATLIRQACGVTVDELVRKLCGIHDDGSERWCEIAFIPSPISPQDMLEPEFFDIVAGRVDTGGVGPGFWTPPDPGDVTLLVASGTDTATGYGPDGSFSTETSYYLAGGSGPFFTVRPTPTEFNAAWGLTGSSFADETSTSGFPALYGGGWMNDSHQILFMWSANYNLEVTGDPGDREQHLVIALSLGSWDNIVVASDWDVTFVVGAVSQFPPGIGLSPRISNGGAIAVNYYLSVSNSPAGVWSDGSVFFGLGNAEMHGISDDGIVSGVTFAAFGDRSVAFLWTPGVTSTYPLEALHSDKWQAIGGPNTAGQAVVALGDGPAAAGGITNATAYRLEADGSLTLLPVPTGSLYPVLINNAGDCVVVRSSPGADPLNGTYLAIP
jgi:hypothetical protein